MTAPRAHDVRTLRAVLEEEIEWRRQCERLGFAPPTDALARRHLLAFVLRSFPAYEAGAFHVRVCERLERFVADLVAGKAPRLILTAPPRHGKSEIVSRHLPVWFMGNYPSETVAVASYGQDLADSMSRKARQIRDQALPVFPDLVPDPNGFDRISQWDVAGGGSYLATGVGGPLTGRGFALGIIDDPVKNMEEADSEVYRQAMWEWYTSTFYTRCAPRAGILVMATRWHEDDLIGRLLDHARVTGEQWEVLEFPAIADGDETDETGRIVRRDGEALHHARYPVETLEATKRAVGPRVWSALYQCRPTSRSGRLFRRDWYGNRYSFDPQRPPRPWLDVVVSIDCNFKVANDSDYVSLGVWGRFDEPGFYRLSEVHERLRYTQLRTAVERIIGEWSPNAVLIEEAANGHALIDDLRALHSGVIAFKPSEYGSKESRAEVASPVHASGGIWLPEKAAWVDDWIEEHAAFPVGKHDDRVDEASQLVIYWTQRTRTGSSAGVTQGTRALFEAFGMRYSR